MRVYAAPAKLNLALHVYPPDGNGYHPLESLVQTIDWCDRLDVELGDDTVEVVDGPSIEDNIVARALDIARRVGSVPPLAIRLHKAIPIEAGLGGGSSDAAAALLAATDFGAVPAERLNELAAQVGADVPILLRGGTMLVTGYGQPTGEVPPLTDFALAVAIPEFGLSTAEVYRRWDQLEGPTGEVLPAADLPPELRGDMPIRNDLLPAALNLEPRLGDFLADLSAVWGARASLTGSGSACFGYFPSTDEAAAAASAVANIAVTTKAASLRPVGVERVATEHDE